MRPNSNGEIRGNSSADNSPVTTRAIMVSCTVATVPGRAWETISMCNQSSKPASP